jgi:hypothetical protein
MPRNSIYALINEQDKEIFLTYSYDTLSSLSRIINEIKTGIGLPIDPNKFQYKLLETIEKRQYLTIRFNYWYDLYKQNDYKFYNKRRPVNYKLQYNIEPDFRDSSKQLLYAKLKSRYREIILGAFEDIEQCRDFIKNYGNIYDLKYANNNLTKEFINGNHK